MRKFFLVVGFVLGYIFANFSFGKNTGDYGIIPNLRVYFNQHEFLPHHWLTFPIYALIIYLLFRRHKKYLYLIYLIVSFLLGAAIQGFTYSDWYVIYR